LLAVFFRHFHYPENFPVMTDSANTNPQPAKGRGIPINCKWEAAAILALVLLAIYFLKVSWRKWPDPIVDSGAQWYAFWRLSQGAILYHDIVWNYGSLSAFFNAALFKVFGPGMMVLATANLLIYAFIVALAYTAFRRAWGWLAAFAATAVFICVFSFSHLSQVGNYNYAMPYAHESTHGMLLILTTALAAARWRRGPSATTAFALGLCGGLAVVLKPEFMLAGGVVGIAAFALRFAEKKRVTVPELAALAAGLVLPTLIFTAWFARIESFPNAFIDASRAWWMVLIDHSQLTQQQGKFTGISNVGANVLFELKSAAKTLLSLALIWAAGWSINRPWKPVVRAVVALAAAALLWFLTPVSGWYSIGRCFPLLVLAVAVLIFARAVRELKSARNLDDRTVMSLFLVLLAGAMLARMLLFPRIYHLGFFQAALAGMVLAAFIVAELPRWTGSGSCGQCAATALAFAVLATGCCAIARKSAMIRSYQTEQVGAGRDRFYAFEPLTDATGSLVNWTMEQLRGIPPQATVMVLPEGLMVNYLTRHVSPLPTWTGTVPEEIYVRQLQAAPPDYVVLLSRDLSEFGDKPFGSAGNNGEKIMKWVAANYLLEKKTGGEPLNPASQKGAMILRRK
jgi:hypothetical protein